MSAGVQVLGLRHFFCKISEDNAPSIAMFQGCGPYNRSFQLDGPVRVDRLLIRCKGVQPHV